MKKGLYLECSSGISGDMSVAALIDLGADKKKLLDTLASLPLEGYKIDITRVNKSGIDACDFNVHLAQPYENHDHDMAYLHGDAPVSSHPTGDTQRFASHAACGHLPEPVGEGCGFPAHASHGHTHGGEAHTHDGKTHVHGTEAFSHEHTHGDEAHTHGGETHVHGAEAFSHGHTHGNETHTHDGEAHMHSTGSFSHEHTNGSEAHTHDGEAHVHGTPHHVHRNLKDVLSILRAGSLSSNALALAERIFGILAEGEAAAHGVSPEQVHFHEVGAVDSIVDITAFAVCMDLLGYTEVFIPVLCEGRGTVRCQHGVLPVPVPAVANIARSHALPLRILPASGEFVTPTGAAIAAAVSTCDRLPDRFRILRIGTGAGKRQYEIPGLLRAMEIEFEA